MYKFLVPSPSRKQRYKVSSVKTYLLDSVHVPVAFRYLHTSDSFQEASFRKQENMPMISYSISFSANHLHFFVKNSNPKRTTFIFALEVLIFAREFNLPFKRVHFEMVFSKDFMISLEEDFFQEVLGKKLFDYLFVKHLVFLPPLKKKMFFSSYK